MTESFACQWTPDWGPCVSCGDDMQDRWCWCWERGTDRWCACANCVQAYSEEELYKDKERNDD